MFNDLVNMEGKLDEAIDNIVEAKLDTKYPNRIRVKKGQRGAIDPEVFKEGFKGLNRALSRLTDKLAMDPKWIAMIRQEFGDRDIQRNSDGTPMVLLHGTTKNIKGELALADQGFHAGLGAGAPHFFTTGHGPGGFEAGAKSIPKYSNSHKNSQIHPVVIRQGNYPFLNFDAGEWSPRSVTLHDGFRQHTWEAAQAKGIDKAQYYKWLEFIQDQPSGKKQNQAMTDFLKMLGIDGFFYRNTAESPAKEKAYRVKNRYNRAMDPTQSEAVQELLHAQMRLRQLHAVTQDPTSFVTWNDKNFVSMFGRKTKPAETSPEFYDNAWAATDKPVNSVFSLGDSSVKQADAMPDISMDKAAEIFRKMQDDDVLLPGELESYVKFAEYHGGLGETAKMLVEKYDSKNKLGDEGSGSGLFDNYEQFLEANPEVSKPLPKGPGKKQTGALFLGEPKPRKPLQPMPQNELLKKQQAERVASMVPAKVAALDEFREIKTPEEALALAATAKDITPDFGQKYLGSGVNFQAIMSNNPLLKYLRTVARDARTSADKFSRDFITNDQRGLSPLWTRMSDEKRINTINALMEGDRKEHRITEEVMDRLGFDETQRKFVNTFYEANDKMYNKWNAERAKLGFDPIEYRQGHFPGIFLGSYKAIVMQGEGNKARAVGVITADTKAQLKIAKKYVMDNTPGATFVDKERGSLVGSTKRYYSDIFSGMSDILEMLGQNDPRFAEVQDIVNKALRESNNKLFAFNVHELHKKGVFGNEGNRPWLNEKENARDAFKAIVRYFEEGSLHHEMQVPLDNLRKLMSHPDTAHMPNAKKFMEKYIKKMTGDDVAPLGAAINTVIDSAFKLVPTASWGGGNMTVGVGVGPGSALSVAGAVKNNMSQYFMGWGNYMFTVAQLSQPLQTGTPFMQLIAGRLNADPLDVATAMGRGGAFFPLAYAEKLSGKTIHALPEHLRRAFQYAEDRGLMTFSEMEAAYQGTQGAVSRLKDQVAEANMKVGEHFTRTPMFMSFVDLMVKNGVPVEQALPIAENVTQFSMIDYHQWERPMLYSSLGVVGQFAGGLTTFKHGYMSQQAKLAREAVAPTKLVNKKGVYVPAQRQISPFIIATLLASIMFAGITGLPFYGELDQVYSALTNTFGDRARSIREDFLEKTPEWLDTGLVSNALGLNLQGKYSAADMVPDNIPEALSPQLSAAGRIAGDVASAVGNPNSVNMANAVNSVTPSAWKGVPEAKFNRTEDNYLLGRDGLIVGDSPRTTVDRGVLEGVDAWKARAATGLRPMGEAVEREKIWNMRKSDMADRQRRTEISQEYRRMIIAGETDESKFGELQEEFEKRGGDPQSLIDLAIKTYMDKQLTEKQRLEGIPGNTLPSVNRFQNYNR
jgi:hypothetical protein